MGSSMFGHVAYYMTFYRLSWLGRAVLLIEPVAEDPVVDFLTVAAAPRGVITAATLDIGPGTGIYLFNFFLAFLDVI